MTTADYHPRWTMTVNVTCRSCPFQMNGTVLVTPAESPCPWYYRERHTRWSLHVGRPGGNEMDAINGAVWASGEGEDCGRLDVTLSRIGLAFSRVMNHCHP